MAIFEINADDQIIGAWFLAWEAVDWMAVAWVNPENKQEVILRYRFRYHRDDRTWNSEDKKSVYDCTLPDHEPEYVRQKMDVILRAMKLTSPHGPVLQHNEFAPSLGQDYATGQTLTEWLMKQDWAHAIVQAANEKFITEEEAN